jgi:hypothetical protein
MKYFLFILCIFPFCIGCTKNTGIVDNKSLPNIPINEETIFSDNFEILRQKINLIIESYYEDKQTIDLQRLENVIEELKNIFIEENDYSFRIDTYRNNPENEYIPMLIFNGTDIIARITLYFDFRQNNDNDFEFIYAEMGLRSNENYSDIVIMNNDYSDDINDTNIRFTHTHTDLDTGYFYYNIYRTSGYEAYSINKNKMMDATPSSPLVETTIFYRWKDRE